MMVVTSLNFFENLKSTEISEEQEEQLIKFYELLIDYKNVIDEAREDKNILLIQIENNKELLVYYYGLYFLYLNEEKIFSFNSKDLTIIGDFLKEALDD